MSIGSFKDNEANRTEVLRLLVVLLSKSMYLSPSQLLTKEDLWLKCVAANKQLERKAILVMLCSFLNTVCNYDPIGWVPYHHVISTGPNKEQLVTLCLTALLILLDYRSPQQADLMRQHDQQQSTVEVWTLGDPDAIPKACVEIEAFTPTDQQQQQAHYHHHSDNVFRLYISKLHRSQDFEFLMDGIYRLLVNPMTAINTYLPGSTKRTDCFVNVMMLCWKLIETNSRFTSYLFETDRSLDLTITLIFHAMDNKDKIAQAGLVRMCIFMLQTLSSNKDYCTKLNKPFTTHSSLPASIRVYAFNGTYADFLIISIFTLIATTHGQLSTLYPALLLTISNISSYLTNLNVTTANKLITLFHSMSSPSFLFTEENNYQLTMYLLEIFNNIINHQYAENSNLIYAIVLHHDYFEKLNALTFEDAMKEVERIRALRAKKSLEENNSTQEEESENRVEEEESSSTGDEPTFSSAVNDHESEETKTDQLSLDKGTPTEDKEPLSSTTTTTIEHENPSTNTHSSVTLNEESNHDPLVSSTHHGFTPSEAWMAYWKSKLPLATIMAMLEQLVPQVEEKCSIHHVDLEELMHFIQSIQLENLPEEGRSIFIRKFQWGEALVIWFRSMMWGQSYVSSMHHHGAWNGTHIKLFQIKEE
ncbi:high-temperature-induced dauer-formation protein-domain-containing protein [Cokeromyces recurvatus]|uniref:high-temperature-induced dauer-formation protein-domain-containing protein n=1 Tax=Cokeromyces recurvatus TaxID=90255 RepID=UPI00221FB72F|nr:high-temperature-induced dauer-formation protein-domain-containing protein [Cokeromyces recurvatus]KAI7897730.1 high-temperature-induced dauer-formation protein-domain-containing protein [Cokeromyces recurvatus]